MNKLRISGEGLSLALPADDIKNLLGSEKQDTPMKPNKKLPLTSNINKENIPNENTVPMSEKSLMKPMKTENIKEEINESEINSHHPQMIDEDVENFTNKLDNLILNFRTDSLKEFMKIKRNVLTEQSNKIEAEKNRCSSLLSSKQDELEHVKDECVLAQNSVKRMTAQLERISQYLKKFNKKGVVSFYKVFKGWRNILKKKKRNEKLLEIRLSEHKRNLKNMAFSGWRKDYMVWKKKKNKEQEDQRVKVFL